MPDNITDYPEWHAVVDAVERFADATSHLDTGTEDEDDPGAMFTTDLMVIQVAQNPDRADEAVYRIHSSMGLPHEEKGLLRHALDMVTGVGY